MTVKEIVEAYLKEHGFGGLVCVDEDCDCGLHDAIMNNCDNCDGDFADCQPGYKVTDQEFWRITTEKPEPAALTIDEEPS